MTLLKRRITLLLFMILAAFCVTQVSAKTYKINTKKSKVTWLGKKIGTSNSGTIKIKKAKIKVRRNRYTGKIIMNMRSLKVTNITSPKYNAKLRKHLNSKDFFHTKKYKYAILKIKKVKKKASNYRCIGTLTIKGITKPIEFDAEITIKKRKLHAKGKLIIDRTLYKIKYGSGKFFEGLGDNLIHDNFEVNFEIFSK